MQLTIDRTKLTPEKMRAYGAAFPVAAANGLNKTATQARTQASTLVRQRYNLKKSDLDRNIKLRRATSETLQASLRVSGKRLPLVDFGARGTIPPKRGSVGVSVEVIKGRRLNVAGSFLAIMKSGHKGIFIRLTKKRLPIAELTGPSIPQMFYGSKVYGKLKQFVTEKLPSNLSDAVKFFQR